MCVFTEVAHGHRLRSSSQKMHLTKWHLTRSLKEVSQPHYVYLSVEQAKREQQEQRSGYIPLIMGDWLK